jgi:hypothetical protein
MIAVGIAGSTMAALLLAVAVDGVKGEARSRGDAVVYVTSQGLYYDTVVNGPLPPRGRFQLLEMDEDGLFTEFGPGDQEYVGGRWMADFDGDGEFDYFSCPLLGPGRENP